jgi:hypothetical protein
MSRLVFLIVSLCCCRHIMAQQWAFELWHEGRVVTTDGDTLKGLIKYDIQTDIIQFNYPNSKKVEAFAPRKVLFFEIFDATVRQYRMFFALPYSSSGTYGALSFFELLAEGKITLLCREALEYRTFSSPYLYGSFSRLVLVYKYFFMDDKGNITEYSGKRADLMNRFGRYAPDVERYIRQNRLRLDERNDFIRVIEYYNSFFKS